MNKNGSLEQKGNDLLKEGNNNNGIICKKDETNGFINQVPQTTRLKQANTLLSNNKEEDNNDKEDNNILIKVRSNDNIVITSQLKNKFESLMNDNNNYNNNDSIEKCKGDKTKPMSNNELDKQNNNNNYRSNSNSKVIHTRMQLKNKPSFLNRMTADLQKRRTKEERLNLLIERNKVKHTEKERINGFNRLIDDANRRIEAKSKMDNLKTHITEENQITAELKKSYNHGKWNEIYKERFEKYQLQSKEKILTKQKELTKKKEEDEEKIAELIRDTSKKIPKEQINQICLRLYEDQRKVYVKEIKESQQEVGNNSQNNKEVVSQDNNNNNQTQTHKSNSKEIRSITPNNKEIKKGAEKDNEEEEEVNKYNSNARNKKNNNNPNSYYDSNTVYKNIPFRIKTEYDHYTTNSSKKKTTKPRTKTSTGIVNSPTNSGHMDIEYIEKNLINSLTQSNVLQPQSKTSSQIYTSEIKQRKMNNGTHNHLSKSPFQSKQIIRDIDAVKLVSNVLKKNTNL